MATKRSPGYRGEGSNRRYAIGGGRQQQAVGPTSAGLAKPDTVTTTLSPARIATGTTRPNEPVLTLEAPKQELAEADALVVRSVTVAASSAHFAAGRKVPGAALSSMAPELAAKAPVAGAENPTAYVTPSAGRLVR